MLIDSHYARTLPMELSKWMMESLHAYLNQLQISKSLATVQAYKYDLSKWLEWLHENQVKRITSLKSRHIVEYLNFAMECDKSEATVNRYYMSIRSFCDFLRRSKRISEDLIDGVPAPKNHPKPPRVLTRTEMLEVLQQPDIESEEGLRDRAIMELVYSSGLRVSEICKLKREDWKGDQILISQSKRGKTRSVPVSEDAQTWINLYLEEYRGDECDGLFVTEYHGKSMIRQRVTEAIKKYAKRAGIKGVSAHTLRHTCATHFIEQGADLIMIRDLLGHSSVATTQRYTHLTAHRLQEMHKLFTPRRA